MVILRYMIMKGEKYVQVTQYGSSTAHFATVFCWITVRATL